MKTSPGRLACSTLLALACTTTVHAAGQTVAPTLPMWSAAPPANAVARPGATTTAPVRPAPGPVADALVSLLVELSAASPPSQPLHQRMDALLHFAPSPQAAAKLARVYGTAPAFSFVRLPSGPGAWNYRGTLAPLHFVDADGSTVDWDAAATDIAVGKDDRSLNMQGSWPRIAAADRIMRVNLLDARMRTSQARADDGLWFGSAVFDIASVSFAPTSGPAVTMSGIRLEQGIAEQPANRRLAQMNYSMAAQRIGFGGDGIDNFRLATRVTGLDRATLARLQDLSEHQRSPEQRQAALPAMLTAMARGAVRSGTALEIDELSASFHGQAVRGSGRVYLDGATEADTAQLATLLKKLAAHFTIKAPVALVRELAKAAATAQLKAKAQGGTPDPQAVAQLTASMSDIFMGKIVAGGFVRVENDMLITDIEYKGSTGLRVNGKPMAMPTPPTPRASVASASPSILQARRIDGRCALPDYPADIIAADGPLQLTMRLIVKADGSVRNVTVSSPSSRPDYDQAVLAAAARCVYIPALRNGQPVDMPVVWKVLREPGSRHP